MNEKSFVEVETSRVRSKERDSSLSHSTSLRVKGYDFPMPHQGFPMIHTLESIAAIAMRCYNTRR